MTSPTPFDIEADASGAPGPAPEVPLESEELEEEEEAPAQPTEEDLLRQQAEAPRRPPGRPRGSRNKKNLQPPLSPAAPVPPGRMPAEPPLRVVRQSDPESTVSDDPADWPADDALLCWAILVGWAAKRGVGPEKFTIGVRRILIGGVLPQFAFK